MHKDIDLTFNRHPITKDLSIRKGTSSILQSLRSIVLTATTDIPFDPRGWASLHRMLGEITHFTVAEDIKRAIGEAIRYREPRVEVTSIEVTPYDNRRGYQVDIRFMEVNIPVEQALSVPLKRLK